MSSWCGIYLSTGITLSGTGDFTFCCGCRTQLKK